MFTGNNNYFTKNLEELKKKNLKYWCSHGNPGDPLTTPLIYLVMGRVPQIQVSNDQGPSGGQNFQKMGDVIYGRRPSS